MLLQLAVFKLCHYFGGFPGHELFQPVFNSLVSVPMECDVVLSQVWMPGTDKDIRLRHRWEDHQVLTSLTNGTNDAFQRVCVCVYNSQSAGVCTIIFLLKLLPPLIILSLTYS